jgi:hypothetical protein
MKDCDLSTGPSIVALFNSHLPALEYIEPAA